MTSSRLGQKVRGRVAGAPFSAAEIAWWDAAPGVTVSMNVYRLMEGDAYDTVWGDTDDYTGQGPIPFLVDPTPHQDDYTAGSGQLTLQQDGLHHVRGQIFLSGITAPTLTAGQLATFNAIPAIFINGSNRGGAQAFWVRSENTGTGSQITTNNGYNYAGGATLIDDILMTGSAGDVIDLRCLAWLDGNSVNQFSLTNPARADLFVQLIQPF